MATVNSNPKFRSPWLGIRNFRNATIRGGGLLLGLLESLLLPVPDALARAEQIEAVGMILADRSVTVESRLEARVTKVTADLGDYLDAGSVLVTLDPKDFRLALETALAGLSEAKAELEAARADYDRKRALVENDAVARATIDEARREWQVRQARATQSEIAVRRARDILSRTTIRAPFAGFVETRSVEVGQIVHPGDTAFGLVAIDPVRVRFAVIERDIARLAVGMPATVSVDVYPDAELSATVSRLSVVPDPDEGPYPVELTLANEKLLLKPGFTAHVLVTVDLTR
jgi:RND family efflux transporter MFP subunit